MVRTGCFFLLAEFKLITHRANAIHFAIRNYPNKIGYIVRYMLCYETQRTTPNPLILFTIPGQYRIINILLAVGL